MALERELTTYKRELPGLLDRQGKFVVIKGDEVAGVWDTYPDAVQAAYERYKTQSFLVKRIEAIEQVQHFTRDLGFPCQA
jgi:hypothetical protein